MEQTTSTISHDNVIGSIHSLRLASSGQCTSTRSDHRYRQTVFGIFSEASLSHQFVEEDRQVSRLLLASS